MLKWIFSRHLHKSFVSHWPSNPSDISVVPLTNSWGSCHINVQDTAMSLIQHVVQWHPVLHCSCYAQPRQSYSLRQRTSDYFSIPVISSNVHASNFSAYSSRHVWPSLRPVRHGKVVYSIQVSCHTLLMDNII